MNNKLVFLSIVSDNLLMIETPLNEHRSQVPKKIIALVLFIVLASISTLLVKIFFDDRSMVDEFCSV